MYVTSPGYMWSKAESLKPRDDFISVERVGCCTKYEWEAGT